MKGDAANTANSAGRNMRVAPKIPAARSALIHHDERIRTANSEFWCSSNFMRSFWGQTPGWIARSASALLPTALALDAIFRPRFLDQQLARDPELFVKR